MEKFADIFATANITDITMFVASWSWSGKPETSMLRCKASNRARLQITRLI
jgi:hypothetical protein